MLLAVAVVALVPIRSAAAATADETLPRYELELAIELDPGRLTGVARVTVPASALRDGAARFTVAANGASLEIDEITTSDGSPIAHSGPDDGGVIDVPVRETAAATALVFRYHLPLTAEQQQPFGYWAFAYFPNTWAYPEIVMPDGTPPPFSDFDVTLEHPASLAMLTSGGHGGDGVATGGSTDTVRVRQSAEHVSGFAMVFGEDHRVVRRDSGGVTVVAFYHPDYEERFARVVDATAEAAAWYRRTYGFFPLEEVGIIQGHPQWGGGYPLPNMYAIHLGILDDAHVTWITAHELGHYYWGGHVLADGERLDWLQLSLGIWSDQLYLAERSGRTLPEQWREGKRQGDWFADWLEAVVAGREQRLGLSSAEYQALDFDYNSLIRHGKAATGLYLQSLQLGPDRFLELQRRILEEYRHRPLPEEEFVQLLVEAGLESAPAFLEAWKQDDARIDAVVDTIAPAEEAGSWSIEIRRTGSVPYPIDVRVRTDSGETVDHVLAADADEDTLTVAGRPTSVQLDPDGVVPMWNSSHPEIRAAFARALYRADIDSAFLPLARELIGLLPDDSYLRYVLTRRLFWLGRWGEAAGLYDPARPCGDYDACLGAVYAARARIRTGDAAAAVAMLETLRPGAERHGALSFWETVRQEASGQQRP